MNIVMMTNTYLPHVGGVARSVSGFADAYRARGHQVLVVCPQFEGTPPAEPGVLRVPAIQNFNGSDFSVVLSMPRALRTAVEDFAPDLIHAHHPFLLGSAAVRLARLRGVPLVFTHHTMFEDYTHYVPGDSPAMRRFVINLSTNFANLSDMVFAPSDSVADILRRRHVSAPIRVVPTGVRLEDFAHGSGQGFRRILGIPDEAFVVGHVGRLAEEKNLPFLASCLAEFLTAHPDAHVMIAGSGPARQGLEARFAAAGVAGRVHLVGVLDTHFLVSAYKALDVFAFASFSETQGMVVTEAMAAGVPVVALDAPGVREVVRDGVNGRLLPADREHPKCAPFIAALEEIATAPPDRRAALRAKALETAQRLSLDATADHALAAYADLIARHERTGQGPVAADEAWSRTLRLLRAEWEVISGLADAAVVQHESGDDMRP